jgi:hypothetical protein
MKLSLIGAIVRPWLNRAPLSRFRRRTSNRSTLPSGSGGWPRPKPPSRPARAFPMSGCGRGFLIWRQTAAHRHRHAGNMVARSARRRCPDRRHSRSLRPDSRSGHGPTPLRGRRRPSDPSSPWMRAPRWPPRALTLVRPDVIVYRVWGAEVRILAVWHRAQRRD